MRRVAVIAFSALLVSSALFVDAATPDTPWTPTSSLTLHKRNRGPLGFLRKKSNHEAVVPQDGKVAVRGGGKEDFAGAGLTFFADAGLGLASLAFLYNWVTVMTGDPIIPFADGFKKCGFCNYADTSVFNTQLGCARFDAVAAIVSAAACYQNRLKDWAVIFNGVGYPIIHGLAHWSMRNTPPCPAAGEVTDTQKGIMFGILSMGPLTVVSELDYKFPGRFTLVQKIGLAVVLDLFLTWLFFTAFQGNLAFALPYINVAINLLLFLSRALLFNPFMGSAQDKLVAMKFRKDTFGPLYKESVASLVFMVLVMWIEPMACGAPGNFDFFQKIGGHIWFDVSLFIMAWVSLLNALKDKDNTTTRKAFFY